MESRLELTPIEAEIRELKEVNKKLEQAVNLFIEVQHEANWIAKKLVNRTDEASRGQLVDIVLEAQAMRDSLDLLRQRIVGLRARE